LPAKERGHAGVIDQHPAKNVIGRIIAEDAQNPLQRARKDGAIIVRKPDNVCSRATQSLISASRQASSVHEYIAGQNVITCCRCQKFLAGLKSVLFNHNEFRLPLKIKITKTSDEP